MDKVYIYWRLGGFRGMQCPWTKYYKRPMTMEKAKAKLAKLSTIQANVVFCIARDGWVLEQVGAGLVR